MLPRLVVTISLVLLMNPSGIAAKKPFVRVRWKGNSFHIEYKTAAMSYALQPSDAGSGYTGLYMARISKITTDYLEEKDNVVYMILNIEGSSRGEAAAMGQCGAGEEKGKGLFVFNDKGELNPPSFVVYESCFNTIESDVSNSEPPANVPAGRLLTQFEYFRSPEKPEESQLVTVNVYFDEQHPETGMTPVESCVMFQPWVKSNRRVACPDKGR